LLTSGVRAAFFNTLAKEDRSDRKTRYKMEAATR